MLPSFNMANMSPAICPANANLCDKRNCGSRAREVEFGGISELNVEPYLLFNAVHLGKKVPMQYYRGMETKKKEEKKQEMKKEQKDKPVRKKGNLARIGCQSKEPQENQVAWYTRVGV